MTSPTCAFSFPRTDYRFTIKDVPSYRPIGSVAAHLFLRRWTLYLGTFAVVFGLEMLFYSNVHVQLAGFYASLIGAPLIGAVVLVNVGADATATLQTTAERVERIIERTWAILIIDVAISLLAQAGLEAMGTTDTAQTLIGICAMFFSATLVYAEPYVALEPNVQTLTLIPFALLRSMMLAWVNISRIFSLFAIQIALSIVELALLHFFAPRPGRLLDTVHLAYSTFVNAPLAALFAIAYLDTAAQERQLQRK